MGWIIFAAYLVCGILYHIFNQVEKSAPEGSTEKKIAKVVMYCIMVLSVSESWFWYCMLSDGYGTSSVVVSLFLRINLSGIKSYVASFL